MISELHRQPITTPVTPQEPSHERIDALLQAAQRGDVHFIQDASDLKEFPAHIIFETIKEAARLAIPRDHLTVVETILNLGTVNQINLEAISNEKPQNFITLLARGPLSQEELGTVLKYGAIGHPAVVEALLETQQMSNDQIYQAITENTIPEAHFHNLWGADIVNCFTALLNALTPYPWQLNNILHLAAYYGRSDMVQVLLDTQKYPKANLITALITAAQRGHAKCVQLLLDQASFSLPEVRRALNKFFQAPQRSSQETTELFLQKIRSLSNPKN